MRKTRNYNLSQYDATDRVTRESFNADNAAVDAALKAIATAAANAGSAASAAQTTANSASSAAATAQSTANTAKTNAATAQSIANSALAAAQTAGNCFIEWGTYTGDGKTDRTFTFSGKPVLFFVQSEHWYLTAYRDSHYACLRRAANYYYLWVYEWGENSARLNMQYATNSGSVDALNNTSETYFYYALCVKE